MREIFGHFPVWNTKWGINQIFTDSEDDHAFTDWGITKLNEVFPLSGKTVLELGPLEAGNTKMLCDFGARRVTAIEGRLENFLKCCVLKNMFDLQNAKFYLGDLRHTSLSDFGKFDACVCSGLLYHLPEPQLLIDQISKVSSRVLINTHFANHDYPESETKTVYLRDMPYSGKFQDEGDFSQIADGLQAHSLWLYKDDLVRLLKEVGYDKVSVLRDWYNEFKIPEKQSLTIFAERKPPPTAPKRADG